MRVYALYLVIAVLCLYAYRDWFKSLCGLILLMAIIEHPDMPKTIFGIQGLNPWNVLLANVVLGWMLSRKREGLTWDMPRYMNVLLILYFLTILVGFGRLMGDRSHLGPVGTGELFSEHLINTMKWVIPGLLLFDGARSRSRMKWGLVAVLGVYFLLALQVSKWMPPDELLSGASLELRSRKILSREIGYHRVNLSMMLAGGSWALLCVRTLCKKRRNGLLVVGAALLVMYAQALTGGRMGYLTWAVVGLALGTLRWRRYLLLIPAVVALVPLAIPSVGERMLQGFGQTDASGGAMTDAHAVTAGRNVIWPYVIDKIGESPAFGHGKLAMRRTGLAEDIKSQVGDDFGHPHNAYLQWMLDNGVPSLLGLLVFYAVILFLAARLFRDRRNPLFAAVGGATLSLVLALLVASMGSQTFYPREGAVGMWAAMGLLLRASIERGRGIARENVAARQAKSRSSPPRVGGSAPPRRSPASVLSHAGPPRFP